MIPRTRNINIELLRTGNLLRSKTRNEFYLVTEIKSTWLHKHTYIECFKVSHDWSIYNIFPTYQFNTIKKTKLWAHELDDLEEVVIIQ